MTTLVASFCNQASNKLGIHVFEVQQSSISVVEKHGEHMLVAELVHENKVYRGMIDTNFKCLEVYEIR